MFSCCRVKQEGKERNAVHHSRLSAVAHASGRPPSHSRLDVLAWISCLAGGCSPDIGWTSLAGEGLEIVIGRGPLWLRGVISQQPTASIDASSTVSFTRASLSNQSATRLRRAPVLSHFTTAEVTFALEVCRRHRVSPSIARL